MDIFNIKLLEQKDLHFVTQVRTDPEVQGFVGEYLITNSEKQKKWYESLINDKSKMYFIFEKISSEEADGGKVCNFHQDIGYIRITNIDYIHRSMCVGGDIAKEYRGKGYAKEMYKLIFDLAFNKLNMHRVWLLVLEDNARARNLYKTMGFIEEGIQRESVYKDGVYKNYISMSLLKNECTVLNKKDIIKG